VSTVQGCTCDVSFWTPRRWKWALWLVQRANWKAKRLSFLWDVLWSSESRGDASGTYSLV